MNEFMVLYFLGFSSIGTIRRQELYHATLRRVLYFHLAVRSVLLSKFSLFQEQFSSRILRATIIWRVSVSPVSVNVCSQCHQYSLTPKIDFPRKDFQTQTYTLDNELREGKNKTSSRLGQAQVHLIFLCCV